MAKFRLEGVKAALFDLASTLVDSSRVITSARVFSIVPGAGFEPATSGQWAKPRINLQIMSLAPKPG